MSCRCRGLVRMVKLPGVGVVVPPEPDHPVLLYRRARRHITLQPVDVDPDVVDPLAAAAAPAAAGVDVPPDVQVRTGVPGRFLVLFKQVFPTHKNLLEDFISCVVHN